MDIFRHLLTEINGQILFYKNFDDYFKRWAVLVVFLGSRVYVGVIVGYVQRKLRYRERMYLLVHVSNRKSSRVCGRALHGPIGQKKRRV